MTNPLPIVVPVVSQDEYTFEELFIHFSKFEFEESDGTYMILSQNDKWMKQAAVIGKKITTTDTGLSWNKFKKRKLTPLEYDKFIRDLARTRSVNYDEIIAKMTCCGLPGTTDDTTTKRQRAMQF